MPRVKNQSATPISVVGSNRVEQLDESDAVAGELTFAATVYAVEIVNDDPLNDGEFIVNGQTITVKVDEALEPTVIVGTASATVIVTGATAYRVVRYS